MNDPRILQSHLCVIHLAKAMLHCWVQQWQTWQWLHLKPIIAMSARGAGMCVPNTGTSGLLPLLGMMAAIISGSVTPKPSSRVPPQRYYEPRKILQCLSFACWLSCPFPTLPLFLLRVAQGHHYKTHFPDSCVIRFVGPKAYTMWGPSFITKFKFVNKNYIQRGIFIFDEKKITTNYKS